MNHVLKCSPLLYLLFITSCNNEKNNIDGGPCSYKDNIYPARLIKLETKDSLIYDAQFEIGPGARSAGTDTVSFHRLTNRDISAQQVVNDSLSVGSVYQFVSQTIISGSCDPHNETIRLEKYNTQ